MILEFFIEPVGGTEQYELNGWPAAEAHERLSRWIAANPGGGSFNPTTIAAAVPTEAVRGFITGVGGRWYKGTRGASGRGEPIELDHLMAELDGYATHEVSFYEM